MIVKIMSDENASDSDSRKGHMLFEGVDTVEFSRDADGRASVYLNYHGDREGESHVLRANVYVMNDDGKTISSFGPGAID